MLFTIFWITWAVLGVGAEVWALVRSSPGDTLSENVWRWLTGQVYAERSIPLWLAWAWRIALLAFFGWLAPHLILGIWY